jgi:hypothetical protein
MQIAVAYSPKAYRIAGGFIIDAGMGNPER